MDKLNEFLKKWGAMESFDLSDLVAFVEMLIAKVDEQQMIIDKLEKDMKR